MLPTNSKELVQLLGTIGALVTALTALAKALDHSTDKSAYDTLSANIVEEGKNQQKMAEDISNLRGYLAGSARTVASSSPVVVDAGAMSIPLTVPTTTVAVVKRGVPTFVKPTPVMKILMSDAGSTLPEEATIAFVMAPDVPEVHPSPAPVQPPDFATATK
jgi:hypothetical protein